jgi:hypothetical protein
MGGMFEKMYHYYSFNREEFLKHHHRRSNVESTFSAVKRRFGDAVRSRDEVSMKNEVLAKFVCFNLCRVILSQVELGIEAKFWDKADGPNDALPMVRRGYNDGHARALGMGDLPDCAGRHLVGADQTATLAPDEA